MSFVAQSSFSILCLFIGLSCSSLILFEDRVFVFHFSVRVQSASSILYVQCLMTQWIKQHDGWKFLHWGLIQKEFNQIYFFRERGRPQSYKASTQFPAGTTVLFLSSCSCLIYLASGASESTIQVVKPIFMTLDNHCGHCFQKLKIHQKLLCHQGHVPTAGHYKQPPANLGNFWIRRGFGDIYLEMNAWVPSSITRKRKGIFSKNVSILNKIKSLNCLYNYIVS